MPITDWVMSHGSKPGGAERFLERLRRLGWPAPEAMAAYHAWSRVSAPSLMVGCDEGLDVFHRLLFRREEAAALEALSTPGDLHRYTDTLSSRARFDLGLPHQPSPNRGPMEWGDLEVLPSLDRLHRPPPPRSGASLVRAKAVLVQALEETGVRVLSWPSATGACPDEMLRLAQELRTVNRELQEHTGWEGPVLGLAGRVALHLGAEYEAGGTCAMGQRPEVSLAPDVEWGLMAHEWVHAWDGVLTPPRCGSVGMSRVWGTGKGAGRCDPTVLQACTRLLDALKAPALTEEEGGRLRIEAWEGRLTRWRHLPSVLAALTAEVERTDFGSNGDAQGLCQRLGAALDGAGKEWGQWCERYPENCRTESRTQMGPVSRAEMCRRLGAEVQTLRHLRAEPGSISVWQEHSRRYDALGASTYLTHPEETLAFSFQGLMSAEPRLSAFIGTDRSPAYLAFPLPTERELHRLAWSRCFGDLEEWWAGLRATSDSRWGGVPSGQAVSAGPPMSVTGQGPLLLLEAGAKP